MEQPTSSSKPRHPPISTLLTPLPARSIWGLISLVVLTVGSLTLAWLWPDFSLMHFLWVAQAVPVLYLLLALWSAKAAKHE
jgi:hypothetical protein